MRDYIASPGYLSANSSFCDIPIFSSILVFGIYILASSYDREVLGHTYIT